jgi:hypothetical protein
VRRQGNPWYFDDDASWWNLTAVAVGYLTRLFASPDTSLASFSDA